MDCGRSLEDAHTQKMWRVHIERPRTGNQTHNQESRAAPKQEQDSWEVKGHRSASWVRWRTLEQVRVQVLDGRTLSEEQRGSKIPKFYSSLMIFCPSSFFKEPTFYKMTNKMEARLTCPGVSRCVLVCPGVSHSSEHIQSKKPKLMTEKKIKL